MEQAEKEAWQGSAHKFLTLAFDDGRTLTNDDIYSESMELEQSICEETQLKYGGVSSSCFKVRVFANAGKFKGCTFTASLAIDSYTLTLGRFTVDSDTLTDDHGYRDLTCYDALKTVLSANYAAWVNTVTFPTTIKAFRNAFFSHIGITQETGALINDSAKVYGFSGDTISGNNILAAICEANAVFGHLTADGKFRYASLKGRNEGLYPAETLYPSDTLYPRDWASESIGSDSASYYMSTLKYEEYTTKEVTRVQIRTNNNDIGAIVGSEGNDLIIEGNILLNGSSTDELTPIATNVLKAVSGVSYTPCSFDCEYMPWLSLGDGVRVTAPNGDYVGGYILHRTISGITALKESIECKGSEYNSEKANGANKSIISLQKKTNELERTSEKLSSTITEEVTRATGAEVTLSSRITQNATEISTKVTQGQVESTIEQKADSIRLRAKNIEWSADNSSMTADGHLTCVNASISGKLACNKTGHGASSGTGLYADADGLSVGQVSGSYGNMPVFSVSMTNGASTPVRVTGMGFRHSDGSDFGYLYAWGTESSNGPAMSSGHLMEDGVGKGCCFNKDIGISGRFFANGISSSGPMACTGVMKIGGGGDTEINKRRGGNVYIGRLGDDQSVLNILSDQKVLCKTNLDMNDQYILNVKGYGDISDARLKEDVESIDESSSRDFVMALRPVRYKMKDDPRQRFGFIAQEVRAIDAKHADLVLENDDGILNLSYTDIIADLVKVVQDQEARIAALEKALKGEADAENV